MLAVGAGCALLEPLGGCHWAVVRLVALPTLSSCPLLVHRGCAESERHGTSPAVNSRLGRAAEAPALGAAATRCT